MPAAALGVPPLLELTGKRSGNDDSQVVFGELVTSRT